MLDELANIAAAATWLMPPPGAPWQWDAECEAVIWEDGDTVIFREELAQVLERLPSRELPKPGALMLLLAACRGKIPSPCPSPLSQLPRAAEKESLSKLAHIGELSAQLRTGVAAKASLVAHVIQDMEYRANTSTETVVSVLLGGLPFSEMLDLDEHGSEQQGWRADLYALAVSTADLQPAVFEQLLGAGVAELPQPAGGLDLPLAVQTGNLLNELSEDPELSGIASVARQLMAAITLPEALSVAHEETAGGVSDIGNRGPLHRLLVSELAHDDDTLAARIASNEALYSRREPSANPPPSRLVLLLDSGVRMWGLPRLFAAAAGLAFLGKAAKRAAPAAYRASGAAMVPLPLWTRDGLRDYLAALDPALSLSAALETLNANLAAETAHTDVVVITHAATAEEPGFAERLPRGNVTMYAAALNREGDIAISLRGAHGLRRLHQARMDLRAISGLEEREVSSLQGPGFAELAIFRADPFPFRLPVSGSVAAGWRDASGGGVCLTDSGILWRWRLGEGAVQSPLPAIPGKVVALLHAQPENCWIAVKHDSSRDEIHIARWFADREDGAAAITVVRSSGHLVDAFVRLGLIYLVYRSHAEVVAIDSGRVIGRGDFPPFARCIGGRHLDLSHSNYGNARFGVFYWHGTALAIPPLSFPRKLNGEVELMFDRAGRNSPWVVMQDGSIFSVEDESPSVVMPVGKVIQAKASPDGARVWLLCEGGTERMVTLDAWSMDRMMALNQPLTEPCSRKASQRLLLGPDEPHRFSVRNKFTHIGVSAAGVLLLRRQKGAWVAIRQSGEWRFQMFVCAPDIALHQSAFGPPETLPNGCRLRCARWPDGSRAFLDSRGLLHLQSSSAEIPEISLVLVDNRDMPAWSSDGLRVGSVYFFGEDRSSSSDAAAIARHLQRFTRRIL